MSVIETRLTDRQATLAGITRAIHQQLGRTGLSRVELRYSTQARVPLLPQDAKQKIALLLRDHGQGTATISVRPHEGPIDDATGEHVLRLTPATRGGEGEDASIQAHPPRNWRARVARWIPGLRAAEPRPARVEPSLNQPGAQPAVNRGLAVHKLRQAVQKGSGYIETDTGTGIVAQGQAGRNRVDKALVIVRLAPLHQVLEPLVKQDPAAIAAMVRSTGLSVGSAFRVSYRFEPAQSGDGTSYANESDVEVRLIVAMTAGTAGAEGQDDATRSTGPDAGRVSSNVGIADAPPSGRASRVSSPASTAGTAMPVHGGGTALPGAGGSAVTVRVLGTVEQSFDKPFDVQFSSLPARLDRRALERAGFGAAYPGLLAVASNSCPLIIHTADESGVQVHATTRVPTQAGREPMPMYFRQCDFSALTGDANLYAGAADRVVVNAPGGAICPDTGRRLPGLVIELRPIKAHVCWPATA